MESVATKVLYQATLNPFLSYGARYRKNRVFLSYDADAHVYRLSGSYVCTHRPLR